MKQNLTFVESNDESGRRRFARKRTDNASTMSAPKPRSRPRLAVTVREGLDLQTPAVIPDGAWAIQPDTQGATAEPLLDIDFTQPWEISHAAAELGAAVEAAAPVSTGVWELIDDVPADDAPTQVHSTDELEQMMADDTLEDVLADATWVQAPGDVAPPPAAPEAVVVTETTPAAPAEPQGPTEAEIALAKAAAEAEQAQEARREAEAARAEAERLKAEARAARAQAQRARRAKAEAAAAKAEAERLKLEADAAKAEAERAKAESAQAAQARAEAERLKQAAREARGHAEQAELVLAQAAAAKADAERLKAEAEAAKRQAEEAQTAAVLMVRQAKIDAAKARSLARAEAKAAAAAARQEAADAKAAAERERVAAQQAKADAEAARAAADQARVAAEARAAALADPDAILAFDPRAYRRGRASSRKRLGGGSLLGISSLSAQTFEPVAAVPSDPVDQPDWPRIGEHSDDDDTAAVHAPAELTTPGPWNDPAQVAVYSVSKLPQVTPQPSGQFRPYQASYGPATDAG